MQFAVLYTTCGNKCMSYAVQCLQEFIIGGGGYASEVDIYHKTKGNTSYIFEAVYGLIKQKLLSDEYYENKGHKVLGKFKDNTNSFEINKEIQNDSYECSYLLTFTQILIHEGEKYYFDTLKEIFVGSYKGALSFAKEIKKMLETEKRFQKVIYKIKKRDEK